MKKFLTATALLASCLAFSGQADAKGFDEHNRSKLLQLMTSNNVPSSTANKLVSSFADEITSGIGSRGKVIDKMTYTSMVISLPNGCRAVSGNFRASLGTGNVSINADACLKNGEIVLGNAKVLTDPIKFLTAAGHGSHQATESADAGDSPFSGTPAQPHETKQPKPKKEKTHQPKPEKVTAPKKEPSSAPPSEPKETPSPSSADEPMLDNNVTLRQ